MPNIQTHCTCLSNIKCRTYIGQLHTGTILKKLVAHMTETVESLQVQRVELTKLLPAHSTNTFHMQPHSEVLLSKIAYSTTTGCWSPFCFCHCPTFKKQAKWISWKDLLKQLPYSEAADQTCYLIKSCCTDTRLTSPSAEPVMPGAWEGRHQITNCSVPGMNELWICGQTLGM